MAGEGGEAERWLAQAFGKLKAEVDAAIERLAARPLDGDADDAAVDRRARTIANLARAVRVLTEVDLWEVSLVTFPMLPGARFSVVSE